MKLTRRFIPIILVAVLVVGGLAYWLVWWETRQPNNTLRLEGHMEATETDLAFKVSGIIQYIFFQEGDWVTTNQAVAGLEAKDLKDEVDRARAALAASQANLNKFERGYRPQEIKEAEAQVGKTKADLVNKQLDYERYENLYKRKVVPGITRDKFEADYLMAKEAHKSAAEQYSMLKEGYRVEDIDQARGQFKEAQAGAGAGPHPFGVRHHQFPGERRGAGAPHGARHDRGGGGAGAHPGRYGQYLFSGVYPGHRPGQGQVRHEGLRHHRLLPRQEVPGLGVIHQRQGGVHPQDGGNLQRAGDPGLSLQDPGAKPQLRLEAGDAGGSGHSP